MAVVRSKIKTQMSDTGVCRVRAWEGHGRARAREDALGDALRNRWGQGWRPVHQVYVCKGAQFLLFTQMHGEASMPLAESGEAKTGSVHQKATKAAGVPY